MSRATTACCSRPCPGDDRADPRLAAVSTLAAEPLARLDRFFREGGPENLRQALRYVATLLGRDLSWSPPAPVGPLSILGAAPDSGRPVALVVFYRANLVAADIAPITALMEALDRQGLAPLAVAVSSLKDPAIRPQLEGLIAAHRPAIILNTTAFSAHARRRHHGARCRRRAGPAGRAVGQRARGVAGRRRAASRPPISP